MPQKLKIDRHTSFPKFGKRVSKVSPCPTIIDMEYQYADSKSEILQRDNTFD